MDSIDLAYLNSMIGEDLEAKKQILKMLIVELDTAFPLMQEYCEAEQWSLLAEESHKMKSTLNFNNVKRSNTQ